MAVLYSCDVSNNDEKIFDGPTHAIVGEDGLVYVSDGYFNSRIVVFDKNGNIIRSWGSKGFSKGQFHNPHGLGFLNDGTLLVCDRDNSRIQRFSKNGDFLEIWQSKELGRPWNLVVNQNDEIFVVDGGDQDDDNPRSGIIKLDKKGNVLCKFSMYGKELGQLDWGHSISINKSGNIYVVDMNNNRAQKFIIEDSKSCKFIVDTLWTENTQKYLKNPVAIAIDDDEVYISQEEKSILVFDTDRGVLKREINIPNSIKIHGIFIDKDKTIWITDVNDNSVKRIDKNGNLLLKIGN